MKKIKKLFRLLPAFCLSFISGLSAVLSNDQELKPAYADDLLLWTSSFETQSVNSINLFYNDSVLYGMSFRYSDITVNLYDSYVGNSIIRVLNYQFTFGVRTGGSSSYNTTYCDIVVPNVPLYDFHFKFELTDFKFLEKLRDGSSQFPNQSDLIWSASSHFNFYVAPLYSNDWSFLQSENVYQRNVVVRTHNSDFNSYDLTTAYVSGFDSDPQVIDGIIPVTPFEFVPALSITEEGIQNNQYNNGYRAGYSAGSEDGFNNGYSSGERTGYTNGYNNGFTDGASSRDNDVTSAYNDGYNTGYSEGFNTDSTASTIFSGILQVGMIPVNFFLSIFNFEILGVNLSAFVSAILTVCLTVIVIRTIKGGGE